MYAENMINQAIQKLERACIHVVEKALNAYLFGSRLDIIGSAIPGYVDDEGSIHFLPTRQRKFLGNLFLMHATKNTEECIAKLKADLAGKTHGYAHWNCKRFLGYQRTKAVALNTLITAPLDDALQYTAQTVQSMYYPYLEKCILNIPESIAQHLLQNADNVS